MVDFVSLTSLRSMEVTHVPGNAERTKPDLTDEDTSGFTHAGRDWHKEAVRYKVRRRKWLRHCIWKAKDLDIIEWCDRMVGV